MKKRNDQSHNEPWEQDYYGTGSTQPPKSYGGIIAVLLVAVILLGSLTTVLGILNIRLFRMLQLQEQGKDNMQLLQPEETTIATVPPELQETTGEAGMLNIQCSTVTDFDNRFYSLPYGCLVTVVTEGGGADRGGLLPGDVITHFNDESVAGVEALAAILADRRAGESVELTVYRPRSEEKLTIQVILDQKGDAQ